MTINQYAIRNPAHVNCIYLCVVVVFSVFLLLLPFSSIKKISVCDARAGAGKKISKQHMTKVGKWKTQTNHLQ